MRTRIVSILSFLIVAVGLAALPARAQSGRLVVVNVPFDFYVKDKALPAGEYKVEVIQVAGAAALKIQSRGGQVTAIAPVRPGTTSADQFEAELVFNRFGDQYVLCQVRGLDEHSVHSLPRSRVEDALAGDGSMPGAHSVSVMGRHR